MLYSLGNTISKNSQEGQEDLGEDLQSPISSIRKLKNQSNQVDAQPSSSRMENLKRQVNMLQHIINQTQLL